MENHFYDKSHKEIDWDSVYKARVYEICIYRTEFIWDYPIEFEWCYSAKKLCQKLKELCVGKTIKAIYVTANNYRDPLSYKENYVHYYNDPAIFIQFEDVYLNLMISSHGLFEMRIVNYEEIHKEESQQRDICSYAGGYCDIENVYDLFTLEYRNSAIKDVFVESTDDIPFVLDSFDYSRIGNPAELPLRVDFILDNNNVLTIAGGEHDGFEIYIK